MDEKLKENILAGRSFVDEYRGEHTKLYDKGWHKGISQEHTPLLNSLLNKLNAKGFSSLQEFFDASELLNIQELGFADREAFGADATEADRVLLEEKWK